MFHAKHLLEYVRTTIPDVPGKLYQFRIGGSALFIFLMTYIIGIKIYWTVVAWSNQT